MWPIVPSYSLIRPLKAGKIKLLSLVSLIKRSDKSDDKSARDIQDDKVDATIY